MKHYFTPIRLVLIVFLLSSLTILPGCTESNIPVPPFTTSQFVSQTTDANYQIFRVGGYDGLCVVVDGNKLNFGNCASILFDANLSGASGQVPFVNVDGNALELGGLSFDKDTNTLVTSCVELSDGNTYCDAGDFPNPDLSDYVPYTGATSNVNLGSKTLTTTGLATLGSIKSGILYPSANSTTAVQIRKADGTTNVLNVDTTNGYVGIGTTAPSYPLHVVGTIRGDTLTASTKITGVKNTRNTATSNLGNSSVEEMALFSAEMTNKFRFKTPDLQEESTNGVDWTPSTVLTTSQLQNMMVGGGNAIGINNIITPTIGGDFYYRLTWNSSTYVFLNQLYFYATSAGKTVNVMIEKYNQGTDTWTTVGTGTFNGWPAHVHFPHSTISYTPSTALSTYSQKVRVTFWIINSPNTQSVVLQSLEWWGGFPAAPREIYSIDRDKVVTFPSGVSLTGDLRLKADNNKIQLGTAQDASIYYNGTNLIINPKEVGSGATVFSAGNVGIGTTSPSTKFHIAGTTGTPSANFLSGTLPSSFVTGESQNVISGVATASNTATVRPILQFRRSRGTLASPTAVQENDTIGSFSAGGYGGSSQIFSAQIDFLVDGAVSTTEVPQRISFLTGTTAANRAERLTIKSDGKVGIGTTSPAYKLDINSGATIGLYVDSNISAAGYITRTDVYDKSKGNALNFIKDASQYLTTKGGKQKIDHNAFSYSKVTYDKTIVDKVTPRLVDRNVCEPQPDKCESDKEVCMPQSDKCHIETETVYDTTYKTITETGVDLGKEVSLLKQAVYELKTINENTQLENVRLKNCAKDSSDFKTYKECVAK